MSDRLITELENLGSHLKKLRKAAGITQLDLEIKSGIDRTHISKIEQGKLNIEFSTIVKLADALEVPLVKLFQ